MVSEVYTRLHWMADALYPTLADAVQRSGPIDLRGLIAQALHMGDEGHNRNRAGTSLLLRALAPALARTCADRERLAQVIEFIDGNDHFFLNLSMPAGKAMLEPAEGIHRLDDRHRDGAQRHGFWHPAVGRCPNAGLSRPPGMVEGLYLPGFTADDANPDIGDSTITETAGYGGFAMAASPAIARFVGGTAQDAIHTTREMYEICFAEHEHFTIPVLEFRGTPVGMDVRLIMETGHSAPAEHRHRAQNAGDRHGRRGGAARAGAVFRGRVRGGQKMVIAHTMAQSTLRGERMFEQKNPTRRSRRALPRVGCIVRRAYA